MLRVKDSYAQGHGYAQGPGYVHSAAVGLGISASTMLGLAILDALHVQLLGTGECVLGCIRGEHRVCLKGGLTHSH